MTKIVHFSDAHIDVSNYGRHDVQTGLPSRALDFLKALDFIVDNAIEEQADLVLFTGDAYKDRTPVPTYQREWGKRMMRLSQAGIPTIMLVGNHDVSPAAGRAHALQEYETLQIPHIQAISKPSLLKQEDLEGLPLQLLAIPWISRSGLIARLELSTAKPEKVYEKLQVYLTNFIEDCFSEIDPTIPVILCAHTSIEGALYGSERSVMLGNDIVLPGRLVKDPRFAYVALGHIHKAQNLNEGSSPPVIYSGSIERVDFGEVNDDKYFVIAEISPGTDTYIEWKQIPGRKFIDRHFHLEKQEDITHILWERLPSQDDIHDAIVRFTLDYPKELEAFIDDGALRQYAENAFEFHLVRKPRIEARLRLADHQLITSLTPLDLLLKYCETAGISPDEAAELQKLASGILSENT